MENIKILVLSLESSNRREKITNQFEKLGVKEFTFFDAFDARDSSINELSKNFDIEGFVERYNRIPAKGEIGCTLSHISILKLIVESDVDNWIILEDDALLTNRFLKLLDKNNFPNDGLTLLGHSKTSYLKSKLIYIKYRLFNIKKYKGFKVGNMNKLSFRGTVSYALTKHTAIKMLKILNERPDHLADDFKVYSKVTSVYTIAPFLVFEDYKVLESSIEKERYNNIRNANV